MNRAAGRLDPPLVARIVDRRVERGGELDPLVFGDLTFGGDQADSRLPDHGRRTGDPGSADADLDAPRREGERGAVEFLAAVLRLGMHGDGDGLVVLGLVRPGAAVGRIGVDTWVAGLAAVFPPEADQIVAHLRRFLDGEYHRLADQRAGLVGLEAELRADHVDQDLFGLAHCDLGLADLLEHRDPDRRASGLTEQRRVARLRAAAGLVARILRITAILDVGVRLPVIGEATAGRLIAREHLGEQPRLVADRDGVFGRTLLGQLDAERGTLHRQRVGGRIAVLIRDRDIGRAGSA